MLAERRGASGCRQALTPHGHFHAVPCAQSYNVRGASGTNDYFELHHLGPPWQSYNWMSDWNRCGGNSRRSLELVVDGNRASIPTGKVRICLSPDRHQSTTHANHTLSTIQNHSQDPFAYNKAQLSAWLPSRGGYTMQMWSRDSVRASLSIQVLRCYVAKYATFPPLWSFWLPIKHPAPRGCLVLLPAISILRCLDQYC